jgi:hypothetical protein
VDRPDPMVPGQDQFRGRNGPPETERALSLTMGHGLILTPLRPWLFKDAAQSLSYPLCIMYY